MKVGRKKCCGCSTQLLKSKTLKNPTTDKIGKFIEKRREKMGLTQRGLGKLMGCGQASIQKIEHGATRVGRISTLKKICDKLGLELIIREKEF